MNSSPLNKHGKIYDTMKYNAEISSKWKVGVLMIFIVSNVDAPAFKFSEITDKEYLKEVYSKDQINGVFILKIINSLVIWTT
jgi:hypothetical protein